MISFGLFNFFLVVPTLASWVTRMILMPMNYTSVPRTTALRERTIWSAWQCCSWETLWTKEAAPAGVSSGNKSTWMKPAGQSSASSPRGPTMKSPKSSSSWSQSADIQRNRSTDRWLGRKDTRLELLSRQWNICSLHVQIVKGEACWCVSCTAQKCYNGLGHASWRHLTASYVGEGCLKKSTGGSTRYECYMEVV